MNNNQNSNLLCSLSKTIILSVCTVITTVGVTACGQKGALYLPENAETIKPSSSEHKQNNLVVLEKTTTEIEQDIQQRIEKMKADPNDY